MLYRILLFTNTIRSPLQPSLGCHTRIQATYKSCSKCVTKTALSTGFSFFPKIVITPIVSRCESEIILLTTATWSALECCERYETCVTARTAGALLTQYWILETYNFLGPSNILNRCNLNKTGTCLYSVAEICILLTSAVSGYNLLCIECMLVNTEK